jgi:hypothetical protein
MLIGLTVPAHAGNGAPQVAAASLAVAPEVWSANATNRELTGSAHADFAFNVPAGHYAISAKLNVRNNNAFVTTVHCELRADSDGTHNWDYGSSTLSSPDQYESLSMSVPHTFATGGLIKLTCYHNSISSANNATLRYVKIVAVRVNVLTHVAL